MRPAIILFAKAPVPGRVKTRLATRYSPEQAAELHRAFVRDALRMLHTLTPRADLELQTDAPTDAWRDIKVARSLQVTGDLGCRMLHALRRALAAGRPQAMIVGSDVPTLPAGHLSRLLRAKVDVALGPAVDGGYYAIACRKTHPRMFAGVEWSGARALRDTVRAAEACGLTVELGETWFDIDSPGDLVRLASSPNLPPHTEEWFRRHGRHLLPGNVNR